MIARVKVTIVPFIQNAQKTITDKMVWDGEKHDEETGKKISSSFGRISISLILLIYNFFRYLILWANSTKNYRIVFEILWPYKSIIIRILISNMYDNIKYNN